MNCLSNSVNYGFSIFARSGTCGWVGWTPREIGAAREGGLDLAPQPTERQGTPVIGLTASLQALGSLGEQERYFRWRTCFCSRTWLLLPRVVGGL